MMETILCMFFTKMSVARCTTWNWVDFVGCRTHRVGDFNPCLPETTNDQCHKVNDTELDILYDTKKENFTHLVVFTRRSLECWHLLGNALLSNLC